MSKKYNLRKKGVYLTEAENKELEKMILENGYKSTNKFLRDLIFEDANPIANRMDNLENELIELKNYIKKFIDMFAKSSYVQNRSFLSARRAQWEKENS